MNPAAVQCGVVIEEEPASADGGHLNTNRAGCSGDKLFISDILQNTLSVKGRR